MTDARAKDDPSNPRRTARSMARSLRLRLESESAAGMTGLPRAKKRPVSEKVRAARSEPQPAAVASPVEVIPTAPSSEAEVAAMLRQELAAATPGGGSSQDSFDFGSPDIEGGVSREEALARIAAEVAQCTRCPELAASRTLTVPGQGSPYAQLMFVGEGPGQEEDRQGLAFVGRAGELLTKMIESIGMTRDQVFIANVVKCRPPGNRVPMPDEIANCAPYLARQMEILRPKTLCALGNTAARALLQTSDGITRLRGRFHPYRGVKLMPTFHPAYVLRNYTPDTRKKVYDDLLKIKAELGA